MRNMLIAVAAIATIVVANTVMAAAPNTHENQSVLVESASDVPSVSATQPATRAKMMVNKEMEQPVILDGQAVAAQPQAVQYNQTHRRHKPQKKQSVFDKLMNLERRKNAWLKKTFLGR